VVLIHPYTSKSQALVILAGLLNNLLT